MKHPRIRIILVAMLGAVAASLMERTAIAQHPDSRGIPDNPCDVLTRAEIAAATKLVVAKGQRVPVIGKIVEAQDNSIEGGSGSICSFDTQSRIGAITIAIAPGTNGKAEYFENRRKYVGTVPGSARRTSELGPDTFLAGGSSLHMLVSGKYVIVSVQHSRPEARDVVLNVGRKILQSFR